MKKLFFIAFALMLSFTTAFAECRNYPKDQPFAELEPDSGSGDEGGSGGGGNGPVYNMFVSKCGKIYTYISSRDLTSKEYDYLQGWYDAQCDKQQWQTA